MPIEIKELIITGKVSDLDPDEFDVIKLIDERIGSQQPTMSVIEKNKLITECVERVLWEIKKQADY